MLATSAEASTDPYVRLTAIVEDSLPSVFSAASEPRLIQGPPGTPDVPFVDAQWPLDEERLLRRYNFLRRLAPLVEPSASVTVGGVASAVKLVDPVTGMLVIPPTWADAAQRAVNVYDLRAARAALLHGVLDYASTIQTDARDALARFNARFNAARNAAVLAPIPPAVARLPAVRATIVPQQQQQRQPATTVPAPSVLGRRPSSERPVASAPRRSAGWSAALQRLIPITRPAPAFPAPPATGQQPQFPREEEEEEPLVVKRRRRQVPLSPLSVQQQQQEQQLTAPYAVEAQRGQDAGIGPYEEEDVIAALLAGGNREPLSSPYVDAAGISASVGRQTPGGRTARWNLASALATAASMSPQPLDVDEYITVRTPRDTSPAQTTTEAARADGSLVWPVDAYVQTVPPDVFRRDIGIDVLRAEARRARSLADAVATGSVASIADAAANGMSDADAAQNRAAYLDGLVSYVETAQSQRRRAREPFDAAYWYRLIAAGGSGPLGVPTESSPLSAGAAIHGPYATAEDARAEASTVGFDADAAVGDAALAWAISALNSDTTRYNAMPLTTVFQVQRPAERDPTLPRQLATRADPGVERWAVAVAAPRRDQTSLHEGAFAVLAWDRAAQGRAPRLAVRDLFPSTSGPPNGVVAVYEAPDPTTAASIQTAIEQATRGAAFGANTLSAEVAGAVNAHYPGAAVDVATNDSGSEVTVTVRLPTPLPDADPDQTLALVRAVYGIAASAGAIDDSGQSRLIGVDGSEAPLLTPPALVGATLG